MKRTIFFFFVSLLLLAGPALSFATGAEEAQTAGAPTKITCWTYPMGSGQEGITQFLYSSKPIGKAMAEKTGVDWDFTMTQPKDIDTVFNLRLASNDWPDVINSQGRNFVWVSKLVKAGVIVPLDKYFNNPKYPNIALLRKNVLNYWRYSDGHQYHFPSGVYYDENQKYGYWAEKLWMVHPDYLKAVGMTTADLKTIEGVTKFLQAVKASNLKTSDGLPVRPISSAENISLWQVIVPTYGVSIVGQGFDNYNGKFIHFRDHPQTKAAFQWLNSLNRDGLLDPEALTQKNESLREKLMGRRIAMMADSAWPFIQTVVVGKTPVTEYVLLDYPKVAGVAKAGVNTTYNPNGWSGLMVTKNCKKPDVVAKYADYFYEELSPSGPGTQRGWESIFGPRGLYWDWDPKAGEPYYNYLSPLKEAMGDYTKLMAMGYQTGPLAVMNVDLNWVGDNRENLRWFLDFHKYYYTMPHVSAARQYDSLVMPPDGLWNKNEQILARLDIEYFAKLITAGSESAFENTWQAYMGQLETQGSWSKVKAEWEQMYKQQVK